jgi:hypothetical protein
MRYAEKRLSIVWKRRKKQRKIEAQVKVVKDRKQNKKPFQKLIAPPNFSLIENTDEVLKYFSEAEEMFKFKDNVEFDISKVKVLTAPTIAFLVANVNNTKIVRGAKIKGNAPIKPELAELFINSGFYDFVTSRVSTKKKDGDLLHREKDTFVVGEVARDATLAGMKNTFGEEKTFDPLYNIITECMANTNNHANLDNKGKCDWWLYVYNDPISSTTSYSFLDLGVGIFESKKIKGYVRNFLKESFHSNLDMVDKLLNGQIETRMIKDRAIRGKGIPEIVGYAKMPEFKVFYIITNDVKIDVKAMKAKQLSYGLNGTFLYWELQNPYGNKR